MVMGKMGVHWDTKAVGVCILGTVAILQSKGNGDFPLTARWYSLYADNFTNVVNTLTTLYYVLVVNLVLDQRFNVQRSTFAWRSLKLY